MQRKLDMSKSASCYFVTGSSTDVGKTYVSSLLVNGFAYSGLVSYMKPVQTGCPVNERGDFSAPDLDFVKLHSHPVFPCPLSDHVPYCFKPACSPHLAASLADSEIDLSRISDSCGKIASKVNTLIIEGAGGLLVPLGRHVYTTDLIRQLDVPVILVTKPNLGTINHTLLSINALRNAGIPLAGVVFNNADNIETDYIYEDNRSMISEYISPVPFCEVTHGARCNERFEQFCKRIRPL